MEWEKQSQNKAKQSQSNPISEKPKMNVNKVLTKDYENMSNWAISENKPNQTQSQDPTPKHPLICTKSREISGITGFIATKASAFAKATADRLRLIGLHGW